MFELVILVLLGSIATEAITEIITKSEIFEPLMSNLALRDDFFSRLLTCPYCLSVWVAGFVTLEIMLYLVYASYLFLIPAVVFSIHRLANIFHCSQDILSAKRHKKNNH